MEYMDNSYIYIIDYFKIYIYIFFFFEKIYFYKYDL